MADCCDGIDQLREIVLYSERRKITPKEVVETFYSKLDPFIQRNRDERKRGTSGLPRGEESVVLLGTCLAQMEQEAIFLKGEAIFDDAKRVSFQVRPRTNYDSGLRKRPNIVYLVFETGHQLILREARTYTPEVMAPRDMRKAYKTCRTDLYPNVSPAKGQLEIKSGEVLFLSEPHLICALEKAIAENDILRITSPLKVLDVDSSNLWYVRDFLPSVRDSSTDPAKLMQYLGTLHGLGLMDSVDSQEAHYCLAQGGVVNIDPDFVTFTKSRGIQSEALGKFRSEILKVHKMKKEWKKERSMAMDEAQRKMDGNSILDYFPRNILEHEELNNLLLPFRR